MGGREVNTGISVDSVMKTSKGFIRLPACSDMCEESHVRQLSLANRISSNRFSENYGYPGVLCTSQLLEHSERLWPFSSPLMYACVYMRIIVGFACFLWFSAYVLGVVRDSVTFKTAASHFL